MPTRHKVSWTLILLGAVIAAIFFPNTLEAIAVYSEIQAMGGPGGREEEALMAAIGREGEPMPNPWVNGFFLFLGFALVILGLLVRGNLGRRWFG